MKKELPLADPPVKHLLRVAYRLAILLTMENTEQWVYSNHIQIGCDIEEKEAKMLFVFVPFVTEVRKNHLKTDKNVNKIINKVIKQIDKGIYVLIGLDEYYMPCRPSYGKNHFMHNVLIYGYDSDKQEFLIQGYSERDIYESRVLKYDEFERACSYYKETYLVYYYKKQKKVIKIKNDKVFNEKLYCYFKSIYPLKYRLFSARSFCRNMSFGMKSYDKFKELIYQQIELCKYDPRVLRGLLAISEQKHCIAMGFRDLNSNFFKFYECSTFFENLSSEYLKLRNLELKFKFNNNPQTAKRIIYKMDQLIQEEHNVLSRYFESVGKPFMFY